MASAMCKARLVPMEGKGRTGDGCGSSPRGSEVTEEVAVEHMVGLERRCSGSVTSREGTSLQSSAMGDGQ